MHFGLDEKTLHRMLCVFREYPQVEKVILYGSRAKDNFRKGSDIDLSLVGKELDLPTLNRLNNDLDDLLLPYTFDTSLLAQIKDPDLIEHIKRVGVILYLKT